MRVGGFLRLCSTAVWHATFQDAFAVLRYWQVMIVVSSRDKRRKRESQFAGKRVNRSWSASHCDGRLDMIGSVVIVVKQPEPRKRSTSFSTSSARDVEEQSVSCHRQDGGVACVVTSLTHCAPLAAPNVILITCFKHVFSKSNS